MHCRLKNKKHNTLLRNYESCSFKYFQSLVKKVIIISCRSFFQITGVPTNYNTEPLEQSSSRSEFKNVPKPVYNDIHSPGEKPYVQIGPLHQTPEMFHFTVIIGPAQNLFKVGAILFISLEAGLFRM